MTIEEINTAKAKLKLDLLDFKVKQKIASSATSTATPKTNTISPVMATIIVGILTLIGGALGTALQGYYNKEIEKQKFESSLITEGLKNGTQADKKNYLRFLKTSNLVTIKDLNVGLDSLINDSLKLEIPDTKSGNNISYSMPQTVQTNGIEIPTTPRIYIHIANSSQVTSGKEAKNSLTKQGYIVPGIENMNNTHPNITMPNKMEVRYCFTEDTVIAKDIIEILKSQNAIVNITPQYNKPTKDDHPKHIEIWFPQN